MAGGENGKVVKKGRRTGGKRGKGEGEEEGEGEGREGEEETDGEERGRGEEQRKGKGRSLYPTSRSPAPDAATSI